MNGTKIISPSTMNVKLDMAKYHKDIECRIVRRAKDGRSGLLKLYRNGVELPTRRNVWIDFVLINNADTHYNVAKLTELNGKAYDVIITDDDDVVHYNGVLKRERQTWCARKFGQPIPEDTLELEEHWRQQEEYRKAHPIQNIHIDPWDKMSIQKREWIKWFIDQHPSWFNNRPASEFSNKELYDAYYYVKDEMQYGS